jgi:hypothetical protein
MLNDKPPSLAAIVAVAAFGLLSSLGAWLIVYLGGFHHAPNRFSPETVFVDGLPAIVMAVLQLLASALAFTWLLQRRFSTVYAWLIALTLTFIPPLLYLLG